MILALCQLFLNSCAQGVHLNSLMPSVLAEIGISNISSQECS